MKELEEYSSKKTLGIKNNKDITINSIDMIKLDDFRHFKDRTLSLGKNITVIFGENGTSKSTLLGLIAHPFSTDKLDITNHKMETKFSDVFKLSLKYDNDYKYHLYFNINDNKKLSVPVDIKRRKTEGDKRFRIIPTGSSEGDGFFSLPTVYSGLSRLYPLVKTKTKDSSEKNNIKYTADDQKFAADVYERVLLKDNFKKIAPIEESEKKQVIKYNKVSIGPSNTYYDKDSISSGEDNLGNLINTMISFNNITSENSLTGIWAIDEFEASLHPTVQYNLFKYLLKWSKKHNVQIIITTHSLYLLQNVLSMTDEMERGSIVVNEVANLYTEESLDIYKNPSYASAYRQLTLKDTGANNTQNRIIDSIPINVLCEDDVSENFLKKILTRRRDDREILNNINYQHSLSEDDDRNTSYLDLKKISRDFTQVLRDANGIVVVDADVERDKKISFDRFFITPSLYKCPIEAELFGWILSLPKNDDFFKNRIKKAKKMVINDAKDIDDSLPIDLEDFMRWISAMKDSKRNGKTIKPFKKWYSNLNKNVQNKIIVSYINDNIDEFLKFREKIISCIKGIYSDNGLTI